MCFGSLWEVANFELPKIKCNWETEWKDSCNEASDWLYSVCGRWM